MPSTHLSSNNQSVSDQASSWFARLRADDVSDKEREEFELWYSADLAHAKAYDKIGLLWEQLEVPAKSVHAKLETQLSVAALQRLPSKQPHIRRLLTLPALGLVILLSYQLPLRFQNWQSDYYTASGQQLNVALNDGSRLTLNTDSAIAVDYSDNQRHIELLRGEVHFKVSPDKSRPFIVSNSGANARAVGTAFSVKKSAADMKVIVSEGSVEVSANNTEATAIVHINQQVDYIQGQIGRVFPADILEALAWQRGQLIFKRQVLSRVIQEVNRYRSGHILIVNPHLKERIVSGVFDIEDPNAVVDAIKTTLNVNSVNLSGKLVLLY